jgi:Spy/CpxP family protein refolding chaperone
MSRNVLSALGLSLVLVALLAQPAQAQRGRGGFGRTQSLFSLAGNEAVQKEIGLTDAAKVEALEDEYRDAMQAELASAGVSFDGIRDLPEAERNAKIRELSTKSAEAAKKVGDKLEPKLKEALTAEQFKRLGEIKIQANGIASLSEATVVKELGLSDEQQKKIAAIRDEGDKATRELFASAGENFREAMTKVREANAKTLAQATDVLDAGQKEKFAALKGKPFDTAQLQGRGRRGNNQN